jgi:excisionase family DNA binding protein
MISSQSSTREFYTLAEVAEKLHVSKMTVYRNVKSKHLPAYKMGRDYRIKSEDLDSFISSLKVT